MRFSRRVGPAVLGGALTGLCCLALGLVGAAHSQGAQQVALTFDDLPRHGALPPGVTRVEVIEGIVDALGEAGAPKAWGFLNAQKIEDDPSLIEVLERWRAAGLPLGNHAYSHMNLHANSAEDFEQDIAKNEPLLRKLMGDEDWKWFRYPFLREGDTLEKRKHVIGYLEAHGYRVAQATLDFEDYLWNGPYARCVETGDAEAIEWLRSSYLETAEEFIELGREMAERAYGREIGHVIVLHTGAFNAVMLPDLFGLLERMGFELTTLDKAQKDSAYADAPDVATKWGMTLLEQRFVAQELEVPKHERKPYEKLKAICK